MCESADDDGGLLELQLDLELGIGRSCIIPSSSSECSSTSSSSLFLTPRAPPQYHFATTCTAAAHDDNYNADLLTCGHVVGWPPVRHFRIISTTPKAILPHYSHSVFVSTTVIQSRKDRGRPRPHIHIVSPYVKVNMDGYPIGRKIHLPSFHSYQTLAQKLHAMFFINFQPSISNFSFIGSDPEKNITTQRRQTAPKLLMGSSQFVLTFEDKEGDWMLVGDVPWRMFCNSVKRLRIMRTSASSMPFVI